MQRLHPVVPIKNIDFKQKKMHPQLYHGPAVKHHKLRHPYSKPHPNHAVGCNITLYNLLLDTSKNGLNLILI